jgi:acetoin utilization deacetylase AcuC-like enzyme
VVLKAKEAEDKYIAAVHSQNHIKLMKEISSKKYDSTRNKIARKYNSIYFNKGSSESAVLAAGSVIEVITKLHFIHCISTFFYFSVAIMSHLISVEITEKSIIWQLLGC